MATTLQERPLSALLGAGQVVTNPTELITYERDGSLRGGRPDGVALPQSLDDVVRVVRWASAQGVSLIARGAGTGLSGGAVAEGGGLIVSFARMNRILEFDQVGAALITEPGVTNLILDETVRKHQLYFPPDPSSGRSATIGGNIAENSGGPHCFKYGVTTNYVNGLQVVLADGQVVHLGGPAVDYPEYDFISLFTGGEGTLGLITCAHLRLMRNPPAVQTMMAAFDSVADAGHAVSAVIARGLVPATMEMMDQKMMGIIEAYVHVGLPVEAGAALIIEVDGYPESLTPQMDEVVAILQAQQARRLRVTQTAEERDRIWYGRKSAFGAMARLAPSYYVLDGTVPRSRLADALVGVDRICGGLNLRVAYVFHAGDGNLHPLVLIEDPYDVALLDRVYAAGRQIMQLCLDLGGSITGEHGVGLEKREYMRLMYGPDELAAMWDVKQVFDPDGRFNPGKVLPESPDDTPDAAAVDAAVAPQSAVSSLSSDFVAPDSVEEAAAAVRACAAAGQALYIQGGGTKFRPPDGASMLSTRALRGISCYALADLYVTAHAGTPLSELQAELAADGMWVPLAAPWPDSTLGGIAASNYNAPLRMRYGAIRDLVMAATAVLPDGRIVRVGRPVVKNVAGYDLQRLFVGAYGTLGLVTELSLRLFPRPRARASLATSFDDLKRGLGWAMHLLPVCLTASALLVCRGCHVPAAAEAPYTLVYTAEGVAEDVQAELAQVRSVLDANGAADVRSLPEVAGTEVWARWIAGQPGGDLVRLGVGRRDLPDLIAALQPQIDGAGFCADLAGGLLYTPGARDLEHLQSVAVQWAGYAVVPAHPRVLNGEGDACGCRYTPESVDLMRRLKARWDSPGVLNPGLLVVP
jgi:D-lactate dehydrogenase (cytochrome)